MAIPSIAIQTIALTWGLAALTFYDTYKMLRSIKKNGNVK